MPTMAREAWTDERLDDLANRMDEGFRDLRADLNRLGQESATASSAARDQMTAESTAIRKELAEVRESLGEHRAELSGQVAKIDARIEGLTRTMQIGLWIITSFLIGLMSMFAAQL